MLFVATTRVNVAPSLVLELLQRIARVIKDYLGVLNEDSLRKNFVLVYELLDEVIVSFFFLSGYLPAELYYSYSMMHGFVGMAPAHVSGTNPIQICTDTCMIRIGYGPWESCMYPDPKSIRIPSESGLIISYIEKIEWVSGFKHQNLLIIKDSFVMRI